MVLAADLLLQLGNLWGEELDRTAAIRANHMVMAAAVVLMLVTCDAIVERDFACQAAFGEQFQGAVDGGVADSCVFLLDQAVKFVGGQVVARFKEGAEDSVALSGLLQAHSFEMAMKDFLGLPDHLTRDGGLIVDALLQHG